MKNKSNQKSKQNKKSRQPRNQVVVREVVRPMSIGAQIGDSLQKLGTSVFKRIIGQGDYVTSPNVKDITANTMMNKFTDQIPKFSSDAGSFTVEHCEFVEDIAITTGFQASSYTINPINPTLFPWLSTIASSFESYSIEGMLVRYNSTSGDATGSNTSLGSITCFVAYDSLDPLPGSKASALQYDNAVSCKPSENMLVGVECDPSRLVMKRLYIGNPATSSDERFYNFGRIVICTQGAQNANTTGELWLHYKIKFHMPKLITPSVGEIAPITLVQSLGVTSAQPFLNAVINQQYSTIPVTVNSAGTGISWRAAESGVYQCTLIYTGTSATTTYGSFNFTNAATSYFPGSSTAFFFSGWGAANTVSSVTFLVQIGNADGDTTASFTMVGFSLPNASTLSCTLSRLY